MTLTKIEQFIVRQIINEKYYLTVHARNRMSERMINEGDIIEVAKTLISIKKQARNNTYLLKGLDTWGEPLYVSVALNTSVVIVTAYYQEAQ
jgi:hypothetical protein